MHALLPWLVSRIRWTRTNGCATEEQLITVATGEQVRKLVVNVYHGNSRFWGCQGRNCRRSGDRHSHTGKWHVNCHRLYVRKIDLNLRRRPEWQLSRIILCYVKMRSFSSPSFSRPSVFSVRLFSGHAFSATHPGQLSLLPSAGREMSTSQSAAMLCDLGVKAGMVHCTCGIPHVPYLSALEMSHDKALYKSTFTNYGRPA